MQTFKKFRMTKLKLHFALIPTIKRTKWQEGNQQHPTHGTFILKDMSALNVIEKDCTIQGMVGFVCIKTA